MARFMITINVLHDEIHVDVGKNNMFVRAFEKTSSVAIQTTM